MKNYKRLIIMCLLIVLISVVWILKITIQNNKTQSNIIMAVISNNLSSINQKRSAVLIDLNKGKIINTIYSSNSGHDLEVAISPDKTKIAYCKWSDNRMDRNLYIKEINSNSEKALTSDINGEIDRISWIDNNTILYVFSGHDSSKFGYGNYIYLYNLRTNNKTLIDNIYTDKSDNKYNTVRYVSDLNKIIFSKGSYLSYMKNGGKVFKNSLYTCDIDGQNIKELISINNKIIGRVIKFPNNNLLAIEAYYYDTYGNEISDIYTYDLEKNELDILLQNNNEFKEYWNILPYDADNMLFTENDKLYNIDIKTKSIKEIIIKNLNSYKFVSLNNY